MHTGSSQSAMDLSELVVFQNTLSACYEAEYLLISQQERESSTRVTSTRSQVNNHSMNNVTSTPTRRTFASLNDSMDTSNSQPLFNTQNTAVSERDSGLQRDSFQRLARKRTHSHTPLAACKTLNCSLEFTSHDRLPWQALDSAPEKATACHLGMSGDCSKRHCCAFDH